MTSGHGRRILSPITLKVAADEIAAAAASQRARVALIGGFALYLYGSDRLTGDVDVVSDRPVAGMPHIEDLTFGGESMLASNGTPVDVVVRSDDYAGLYEDALFNSVPIRDALPSSAPPEAIPDVRIVRPEYLVAMKMAANRTKDWADLDFMASHRMFDEAKARGIVLRFLGRYAVDDFSALVDESEWQRSRPKRQS